MWIAKICIDYNKNSLISNLCKKYNVSIYGYPTAHNIFKDYVIINGSIIFNGLKVNVNNFINELKKDKRLINIEINNNYGIMSIKQHIANALILNSDIIPIKPYEVNNQGEYTFELGSWKKESLTKLIENYRKHKFNINIIWIKNIKPKNIFVISSLNNLTDKQEYSIKLAIENNYYDYPRKITLKKLANIAKISYSTYQFHLRKAERKLIQKLH
ncbi:MAG: helix-turn-helix domain-containing protein [Nanoarchaeota archaeon]